jgi:phosphoesterase RecJ-like protein
MRSPEPVRAVPDDLVRLLSNPPGPVLLLAHVYPDGDVLGSLLGLGLALLERGYPITMAGPHPVPDVLHFLPGASLLRQWSEAKETFDLVLLADCPDPSRTHGLLEGARSPTTRVVNIDHHPDNKRYGDVNWIDPTASASGEMVYSLLLALTFPITREIATNLFTALHTDTGSFRYSNTTSHTLKVAADLVTHGADPARVAAHLYETRPAGSLKLLGRLLQEVEMSVDGNAAWLALPAGSVPETFLETEDLVTYPRSIAGVKVAFLLREVGAGGVKASLRAKGEVDVGRIAARFGGGGHANAAGCMLRGSLEDATRAILQAVSEAITRGRDTDGAGREKDGGPQAGREMDR